MKNLILRYNLANNELTDVKSEIASNLHTHFINIKKKSLKYAKEINLNLKYLDNQ